MTLATARMEMRLTFSSLLRSRNRQNGSMTHVDRPASTARRTHLHGCRVTCVSGAWHDVGSTARTARRTYMSDKWHVVA